MTPPDDDDADDADDDVDCFRWQDKSLIFIGNKLAHPTISFVNYCTNDN